jgi:hypothetical protein
MKKDRKISARLIFRGIILLSLCISITACAGFSKKNDTIQSKKSQTATDPGRWTWVSGDKKIDEKGEYGDRGVAEGTNKPGARYDAVGWTDTDGNLWLFGGFGYDRHGAEGYLNDLWKYEP